MEFAGNGPDSCHCSTPVKQHNLNLAPRIGVAYRIDDKTVIRAGYGIFYAHAGGVGGRTNGRQGLSQVGFNNNGSLSSAVTGQPAYVWDNGYPGNPLNPPFFNPSYGIGFITAAAGASVGSGPTTAQTVTYGDPNYGGKAPYYEDWSLNVQHSFTRDLVLSVAYSASAGHWLPGAGVAGPFTNQIPVQYLPLGSLLTTTLSAASLAQAQAIFPNISIPFPNFTGTIGQALKPFPQYNGISDPWLDVGNSTYNSLQVSLNHRFSQGLTAMVNYTYSKELDDLAGVRDPNKDFLEKGPGTIDHPHVAQRYFRLPVAFRRGSKMEQLNKVAQWSHQSLADVRHFHLLPAARLCRSPAHARVAASLMRPAIRITIPVFPVTCGRMARPERGNLATTAYLNKAAFVDPAAYTAGSIARSAPFGLFAPHIADLDLSVRREFSIREHVRLAIQADAFNVNNAVHFAAPGTGIDSATFGIFSSMANQPRKLQFSGRITF